MSRTLYVRDDELAILSILEYMIMLLSHISRQIQDIIFISFLNI